MEKTKVVLHTDQEILARLNNGDQKALSLIFDLYWKPLFISSYSILKKKEVCEDLVQEVFLDIWINREKLKITISMSAYLYACTRYKCYQHIRKNKNKLNVELIDNLNNRFSQITPITELMHKELVQHIESVVSTLPEKCRLVYKLSREKQLSHKEIAEQLNISTKTVENHITKALRILRLSMGNVLSLEMVYWLGQNLLN